MARSTKTQQDAEQNGAQTGTDTPSPEQIAQHFMQLWQDQWQSFLQAAPAMAANWQKSSAAQFKGFGFPAGFGQHPNHGTSQQNPTTATAEPATSKPGDALELATAALAASEQCLELLKQCGQWMDGINQRITALEQYHVSRTEQPGQFAMDKPGEKFAKPAAAKRKK